MALGFQHQIIVDGEVRTPSKEELKKAREKSLHENRDRMASAYKVDTSEDQPLTDSHLYSSKRIGLLVSDWHLYRAFTTNHSRSPPEKGKPEPRPARGAAASSVEAESIAEKNNTFAGETQVFTTTSHDQHSQITPA